MASTARGTLAAMVFVVLCVACQFTAFSSAPSRPAAAAMADRTDRGPTCSYDAGGGPHRSLTPTLTAKDNGRSRSVALCDLLAVNLWPATPGPPPQIQSTNPKVLEILVIPSPGATGYTEIFQAEHPGVAHLVATLAGGASWSTVVQVRPPRA